MFDKIVGLFMVAFAVLIIAFTTMLIHDCYQEYQKSGRFFTSSCKCEGGH